MKEVQENNWRGRSLESYKLMHRKTAEDKGVSREFQNASTLTEAKKILFGYKKKNTKGKQ